uniref:Stichopin n=1 Tax=Stichopus japonicus TaxID=307972 RepID=A0A346TLN7_STIJA|nr:stichopin precursor [Apostichopus japonicus]
MFARAVILLAVLACAALTTVSADRQGWPACYDSKGNYKC